METIEHVHGTQRDLVLTLRGPDGSIYDGFLPGDTPSAAIWPGDQQGILASPAATWLGNDPTSGKVALTITADDVEALAPAVYQLAVTVARGAVRRPALRAYYRILPSAGGGTPLKVYGDYGDLLVSMPTLDDIQASTSQAGLMEERAEASRWLESIILAKAVDEGDRAQIAEWLDGGRLVVDRNVRRMVADYALGLALQGRLSGKGPDDPYPAMGRNFAASARARAKSVTVHVDASASGDGSYPLAFNLSVINARRG
jgi:hypothetical protein